MSSRYAYSRLIPVRFVTMIAHFVLLLMAMNCRDVNVKACLPYDHELDEYYQKDDALFYGLTFGIGLLGLEMVSFLFGFSMFMPLVLATSIACHSVACFLLSYWLLDLWDCTFYWLTFIMCNVAPSCIELGILINMLAVRKILC